MTSDSRNSGIHFERWAIIVLIVISAGLGVGQYQTARAARDAQSSAVESEEAAVAARTAALRADAAATRASEDLASAIAAPAEVIDQILILLCTVSDPVRQAKCAELGVVP